MNDSIIGPHIKTAKDYLDAARARIARDRPSQWAADYGLRLLSRLLDEVRGEIDGWEMAELAAVYDTLALLVAEVLDTDTGRAFRVLAVVCGDEEARRLTRGQPEPTTADLQLFRSRVLWITVTYETQSGGRSRRIVEITHKTMTGDLRLAKSALDFDYEDLPDRVRKRMTAGLKQAIRYQLYPAPDARRVAEGG